VKREKEWKKDRPKFPSGVAATEEKKALSPQRPAARSSESRERKRRKGRNGTEKRVYSS